MMDEFPACCAELEVYRDHMFPTLRFISESAQNINQSDRYEAVKFAADKSLAITGSGSCWSIALRKKLRHYAVTTTSDSKYRISRKGDLSLRSRKFRRSNHSIADTPTEILSTWRKEPGKSSLYRSRKDLLLKARNGNSSARYRTERFRTHTRLAVSNLKLASCIRRICSVRAKRSHSFPRRFSTEDRCQSTDAKAMSCKFRKHNQIMSDKIRRKVAKKSKIDKDVKRVKPREGEESFFNRVQLLQQLVPGGSEMNADHLLYEAVDYAFFLQFQVNVMKSLVTTSNEINFLM